MDCDICLDEGTDPVYFRAVSSCNGSEVKVKICSTCAEIMGQSNSCSPVIAEAFARKYEFVPLAWIVEFGRHAAAVTVH